MIKRLQLLSALITKYEKELSDIRNASIPALHEADYSELLISHTQGIVILAYALELLDFYFPCEMYMKDRLNSLDMEHKAESTKKGNVPNYDYLAYRMLRKDICNIIRDSE